MEVSNLLEVYHRNAQVGILTEKIRQGEKQIYLKSVKASFLSVISAVISQKIPAKHHVIICEDREKASYYQNDLENLLGKNYACLFPMSYKRPYQFEEIDNANVLERAEVLNKASEYQDKSFFILTYPEAIAEKVVNKKTLIQHSHDLKVGEQLDINFLSEVLIEYGFEKGDFVYEAGDFSVRGGIIDIFSFSNEKPYRIELWGNEIESIRTFDPESQLSLEKVQRLIISPDIQNKLITETRESLIEFLNEPIVWVEDFKGTNVVIEQYYQKCLEVFDMEESPILSKPEQLFLSTKSFKSAISDLCVIEFGVKNALKTTNEIHFAVQSQQSYNKKFDLLAEDLKKKQLQGYALVIASDSGKQLEKIRGVVEEHGGPTVNTLFTSLYGGFVDEDEKFLIYTDHQLFDRFHRFRTRTKYSRSKSLTLNEIKSLQPGDFVTHIDYGVGRFAGLEIKEIDGKKQESVRLIFKGDDILYVGVHALHKIAKYSGSEGSVPQLSKLGSGEWEKKKSRVKSKVKELAIDLLKLYAKRMSSYGFAFSPDGYLQTELETSFLYEDTPDQAKATNDVKNDMEKPHPMDRLVCGDVGFGKTEVAMRAAFKAATDGKQVVILVPTTVLAMQHYKTFKKRMEDLPVTIDYINRFRTAKDVKEIEEKVKNGKIDILIGTHGVVGKRFQYKDLGLLVIDEEQKFGVAIKEQLKELRAEVDVLTLTATPIPRTLQFSLMGARDLSVIHTPPPNRQPVTTEVHHFEEELIRDAISAELRRGGQVFFVHNRVNDIDSVGAVIKKLVPDATVCVAHGQMEGKLLEKTMLDFMEHEYDVLISTNIIESGIDIPNANTIIINNAHAFGLSDLHQMRGRVGRSNKKAFCYLITPTFFAAASDSMKRLRTLEEFSDLGDGFKIAMKDLDLRGAGDVLGGEQSGFISDVGFETYQKLLEEAVDELKENEFKSLFEPKLDYESLKTDCNLETDLEILIPNTYVSNISERLRLYNKLDNLKKKEELDVFKSELVDRFGKLPPETEELTESVRLRWQAERLGFEKLTLKSGKMQVFVPVNKERYFQSDVFGKILAYIQSHPKEGGIKEIKDKMVITFSPISSIKEAIERLENIS